MTRTTRCQWESRCTTTPTQRGRPGEHISISSCRGRCYAGGRLRRAFDQCNSAKQRLGAALRDFRKASGGQQRARINFISPEYFSVLHIPLLQGRFWDETETMHGSKLALINQTLARQYFSNGDAIGSENPRAPNERRASVCLAFPERQLVQVIGTSAILAMTACVIPPARRVCTYTIRMPVWTQILVEPGSRRFTVLRAVREQIHTVDPDQQSIRDVRVSMAGSPRSRSGSRDIWWPPYLRVCLACAGAGRTGLYSVISYTVANEQVNSASAWRSELGERCSADGVSFSGDERAARSNGRVLTITLNRVLAALGFRAAHSNALVLACDPALVATSGLSCLIPARRASSVDPIVALRYE